MLENLNDYLSLIVLISIIMMFAYLLFLISNKNHESLAKKREQIYLSFLDDADDDDDLREEE